ncbi:TetR/AcrR family transcriptional regulator [Glycomyces mayteni]|uniref:TetR/AcrR family transcriptional regulator n=1 Tax=Glycomyces mayteni TaxID=543887 RepID=A0ABW2D7R0_9ACTN
MQAEKSTVELTVTEAARRTQIVAAAIETVAELGYARASFAKIADRAGLSSTSRISYHFAGKDDLLRACVAEITEVATDFMRPRVDAAEGYAAKLRAYIEANLDLLVERPAHLRALVEILRNVRGAEDGLGGSAPAARTALFAEHLRAGQRAGEFGSFDPDVLALALTGAIDAFVGADHDGADLRRNGIELADAFDRATRAAS